MHPSELVEVAGLVALHGHSLLAATSRLNDEAVSGYWTASRCRLDRWGFALRAYGHAGRGLLGDSGVRLGPLAEEIILSEILTRCVAAMFLAHDQIHHRHDAAPIGRNILVGHREAIDRLHAVTAARWSHEAAISRDLQSLKERCERWTDLLLGCLHFAANVNEFAFDASRMNEFAEDVAKWEFQDPSSPAAHLLIISLRASFPQTSADSPNDDLHTEIAGAALGCFGAEAFDSFGLLRSTWLDRLQRVSEESLAAVTELFKQDSTIPPRGAVRRA